METKNIILKLRTERGMSQDELADKIMVTRQAVSRWENGDTVPNTDTLKLLSKEFDVSINTLLGEPRKLICQCCGMPIDDDSILGRDKDMQPMTLEKGLQENSHIIRRILLQRLLRVHRERKESRYGWMP